MEKLELNQQPDQILFYLGKRKKETFLILDKIRKLSLLNTRKDISYLIEDFFTKDKKQSLLKLEEDSILNILEKTGLFKIVSTNNYNDIDFTYNIKIGDFNIKDFEINLLQELNKKNNSIKHYSGDLIKNLILIPDKKSQRDMKIIINGNEDLGLDVDRTKSNWKLLYKIGQKEYIEYNPSEHKNIIYYLNKGTDCRFYSNDKYKPTEILKVKNGIIIPCIPIHIKKRVKNS